MTKKRDMAPYDRGRAEACEGLSINENPWPPESEEGKSWLEGWKDETDANGEPVDDTAYEMRPVELHVAGDGRMRLCLPDGTVLGDQFNVVVDQSEEERGVTVQVTFTGVPVRA